MSITAQDYGDAIAHNLQTGLFFDEQNLEKGDRVEYDYYPTPKPLTRLLLKNVPEIPALCFEPCAGQGAISDVLRESGREVFEWDLQWERHGAYNPPLNACDATDPYFWWYWPKNNAAEKDWATVTNPPFSEASKILPLAYESSPWGVAFLLRLSYLEPAGDRAKWLQDHADNLRYFIPVNPRPQFRRNSKGTDSSTVAWCVWQKSWSWQYLGIRSPFQFESGWKNNLPSMV